MKTNTDRRVTGVQADSRDERKIIGRRLERLLDEGGHGARTTFMGSLKRAGVESVYASTVTKLQRGEMKFNAKIIAAICEQFDVTVQWLMDPDPDAPRPGAQEAQAVRDEMLVWEMIQGIGIGKVKTWLLRAAGEGMDAQVARSGKPSIETDTPGVHALPGQGAAARRAKV